jgi:hypothetical protein
MEKFLNMTFEYSNKKVRLTREQTEKHFKICDSIFFTDCVNDDLTLMNLIEAMPLINQVLSKKNLNLNRSSDFKIAKNYLYKAVKYN